LLTNPDLQWDGRRMFPEAYRYTVTEGAPVRLPEPRKWWGIVAAIVGAWLILSTIGWLTLVNPTRRNLAITRQALDVVTDQHAAPDTSSRWRTLTFTLQNGKFQLELPAALPMARSAADSAASSLAPFLIAVDGSDARDAASRIQAWLSSGLSTFPRDILNAAPQTRSVVSVQHVSAPEGVTTAPTTLFFLVDPGLNAQDLALHPTLTFPVNTQSGATDVTLYLSAPSTSAVAP
jgi:hypothetical protein